MRSRSGPKQLRMEYWPTEYGEKARTNKKGKRRTDAKGPTTEDESDSRAYPLVEQGSVAAASLIRDGRKTEWAFLGMNDSGRRLYAKGSPVKIFPATFLKALATPRLSNKQKAEQGAHFLRTHYPDVDIASELIRGELAEDAHRTSELLTLHPYCGNKLALITCSERTRRKSAYLAFPVGPTGCDLNVSPLPFSRRDHVTFKPSAKAVKTFDTPIDQIIGYGGDIHEAFQGTYMAIRTAGSTHVAKLECEASGSEDLSLRTLANWTRLHTDSRHIVDLAFPPSLSAKYVSILAVTDHGRIYQCSADPQRSAAPPHAPNDAFWRIMSTAEAYSLLLLSSSTLSLVDFRSKSESLKLFTSTHAPLTSVEAPGADHMVRVVTTNELVWIDERFPRKPMFGWKHRRQKDRTLQLHTMRFQNGPLTFMTSSKNSLVTVYDVAREESGLPRIATPAYSLSPFTLGREQCIDSAFVRHPSDTGDESVLLIQLSDRGSIHRLDLSLADAQEYTGRTHIWSHEVQQLDSKTANLGTEYGQLSGRMFNELDLEPVSQRIFALDHESSTGSGEALYNTLEGMQFFWNTLDEPVNNMLTILDVVIRSGSEPDDPDRTVFFAGSELNSGRGFRALIQQRIPLAQLATQSAWHNNILSTVHGVLPELSSSPEVTFERLKSHDLQLDDYRTGSSIRREIEAREQLTLDLSLCMDVYSPHPIKPTPEFCGNAEDEAFETMSRATEAMSIGVPEPPPVHFGFLRPGLDKGNDHYAEDKDGYETKLDHPLGVRLLLKDWDVGADPQNYVHYDPYGLAGVAAPRPVRHTPIDHAVFRPSQQSQSQRAPPVIAATTTMAPPSVVSSQPSRVVPDTHWQSQGYSMTSRDTPRMGSQAGLQHHPPDGSQSQDTPMPSTQVLPGPFGGRPLLKKKPSVVPADELESTGQPFNILFDSAARNEYLRRNKSVVCAISASYVSTFAGYPVYREEGVIGFYRGLWIPLITISFVRAASFTIYTRTKEYCRDHNLFMRNNLIDAATTGGLGGALSGSLISIGSTPFELIKVRRQLEYSIAESQGQRIAKPPNTMQAVREIYRNNGVKGLYTGFKLHCLRDTLGTSLYFFEYDGLRHIMGRLPSGEQGPSPSWMPIHSSLVPFLCGSLAGVSSWALIYPLDVVKTKVQQRALAGTPPRGVGETLHRLIRGPDPNAPRSIPQGMTRIYRGLGVSALRSVTTHGLLWTLFDVTASYIDNLPYDD
ncbi:hypothetical protein BC835DRAFT_1304385 [Cytidiella melzeri]|nr:hypothetical protein BC835DRAFT_1304385 [Cytidiella melzeri]